MISIVVGLNYNDDKVFYKVTGIYGLLYQILNSDSAIVLVLNRTHTGRVAITTICIQLNSANA